MKDLTLVSELCQMFACCKRIYRRFTVQFPKGLSIHTPVSEAVFFPSLHRTLWKYFSHVQAPHDVQQLMQIVHHHIWLTEYTVQKSHVLFQIQDGKSFPPYQVNLSQLFFNVPCFFTLFLSPWFYLSLTKFLCGCLVLSSLCSLVWTEMCHQACSRAYQPALVESSWSVLYLLSLPQNIDRHILTQQQLSKIWGWYHLLTSLLYKQYIA